MKESAYWDRKSHEAALTYLSKDAKLTDKRRAEALLFTKFEGILRLYLKKQPHQFNLKHLYDDLLLETCAHCFRKLKECDPERGYFSYLYVMISNFTLSYAYAEQARQKKAKKLNEKIKLKLDQLDHEECGYKLPKPLYDHFTFEKKVMKRAVELIQDGGSRHGDDVFYKLSEEFDVPLKKIKMMLKTIDLYG